MKAHIVALSAVAVVSMAGNGYLYQQLDQLNTSYESLNSSYATANAEFAEQTELGETLAAEIDTLKAEIAKKEALAAEAAKTDSIFEPWSKTIVVNTSTEVKEEAKVSKEVQDKIKSEQLIEPKKPTDNKPKSDNDYADLDEDKAIRGFQTSLNFSEDDAKNLVYALKNYQESDNTHYEGPLYGTSLDFYPTEYQELIIQMYQTTLGKSREEVIKTFTPYDPWGGEYTEFVRGEVIDAKPTGRPYPGLG